MTRTDRRVLHIVPYDLARGAQRYAQALVDELEGKDDFSHLLVTLFAADQMVLRPDVALDVPKGVLRSIGLDPRVVFKLRRVVRKASPDVVVAHGGESAKYVALSIPRSMPMVYLKIGTEAESLQRRGRRLIHDFYARRADVIAGVSTDVVEEVARTMGIARDRLTVIPNARDPELFPPAAVGSHDRARLVFVGHLNPGKRPDWYIEAVGRLREEGTPLDAVIVGDGPLEDRLRPAAEEAGVEMLGKRDDVPALLADSEIFVFTSLPPGEGMPGVLIEAGMAGLATVCTDVPGARDVVEDGVTGLVVEVDDKDGLVDAMERLARDRDLRMSMGAAARRRCLERFTFDATGRLWSGVFASLLDGEETGAGEP